MAVRVRRNGCSPAGNGRRACGLAGDGLRRAPSANSRASIVRASTARAGTAPLAADTEFLQDRLVALRTMVFKVRQKSTPLGHHDQESSPGGMVLLVRLEMLRQLRDAFAQQSNLYFWRSGIGFVGLIP